MHRKALIEELNRAIPAASEALREQAIARSQGRFADPKFNLWTIGERIANALDSLPELSKPRGHIDFGGAGMLFGGRMLANRMMEFAVQRGTEGALAWLDKVIGTTTAELLCVQLVRGIVVKEPIVLDERDISLIPFEALPESDHKQAERAKTYGLEYGAVPTDLPAHSALTMPVIVEQFFNSSIEKSRPRDGIRELERVAHALSMITGKATLPTTGWAEYLDPDLEATKTGRAFFGGMEDVGAHFVQDHAVGAEEALSFTRQYFSLPADLRDFLDIAIRRLNQAMRRRDPMDKALDATISLEVLLGDKDDRGEITERLSRRGAILVGGDLEARCETRHAIRQLYKLRSAVVHTGRVGGLSKKTNAALAVNNGIEIGIAAVRELVKLQAPPPWSEWELMGRPEKDPSR